MQILQPLLDLWPNLSSFVSILETLSTPFLLMFVSSTITILTLSCKILRLLKNFIVGLLIRVKKKVQKQPHMQQKYQKQIMELESRLQKLQAELKLVEEDEHGNHSLFKVQR